VDASILRSVRILGVGLQNIQSRTSDERCVVAGEIIGAEKLSDFHFNKLDELFVVNHVALVQENNDLRHANLTGKKDVLAGLGHRAICCRNNENSAVHLSCTGDHVLNIVSMAGAVHVSIVTVCGLILNVSGIDGDTSFLFLGSRVDSIISLDLDGGVCQSQNLGDSSGKRGLTMVNVTDCANVNMWLVTFKFCLSHL